MSRTFSKRIDNVGLSMIRQIMLQASGCANLGIGEPEFFSPQVVRGEALRVIREEKILYSPPAGLPHLCEAIRAYHGNRPDDKVCITNGSQEAMFDLLFALIDAGDEVLLPQPGFVAYPTVVRMAGGVPVFYSLPAESGFAFSKPAFQAAFSPRTKAVLVNSPSNPTGQVLSREDLEYVARCSREAGAFLISDEIYREIHYLPERPASMADVDEDAILLSGVSKMASMTGWRIGWVCGPGQVVEKATVMHQYTSSCASTLAQKAALEVFTEEGTAAMGRRRAQLRSNRDQMCNWIEQRLRRCFVKPDGAIYLMLDVSDLGRSSLDLSLELLQHRVAVIPGAAFGVQGEGYLRLSFASSPKALEQGLKRLEHGLDELATG